MIINLLLHLNYKNYLKISLPLFLFIIIGILFSCTNNTEKKVQLFAAAGTMLPSNEICNSYLSNTEVETKINFAASGILARQIKAGAEADIYISANKQWIDFLNDNKLIIESSISEIARNKLVIICKKNENINLKFSKEFDIKSAIKDNISVGDPKYVPVGKYAKQVLDSLNWYDQIQSQIILAKDVTSVLHYVEMGECDWGIVYYSEAIRSDKVKIAYKIPQKLYDPIKFYIAILKENKQTKQLYSFFKSDTAKEILNKYGFITKI